MSAIHASYAQGKTVLFVTMENSKESIESRLDALQFKIPFGDLRQSLVDYRTELRWEDEATKISSEKGDIFVVDDTKVKTVPDIDQLVSVYDPDFVIIDGAYKLDAYGQDMFNKSHKVLNQLHQSAGDSDAAWLATSQLNPSAEKAVGGRATAYEARGNKGWVIDPATVMVITQTPDQLMLNRVQCEVAKIREAGGEISSDLKFLMLQDRTNMVFDEIQPEDYVNQDILELTM